MVLEPEDEDIFKLADHAANLIYIIEFFEKLGTTKNPLVAKELHRASAKLVEALEREHFQGGRYAGEPLP